MSPSAPAKSSSLSKHCTRDNKENTLLHSNGKHPVLRSPAKRQPTRPPLSPRRDANACPPSPLLLKIRGGGNGENEACAGKKINAEHAVMDGNGNGSSEPIMDAAAVQDGVVSCLVVSVEDPGAIGVAAGMDDIRPADEAVVENAVEAEVKEKGKKSELIGAMSGEDVKSALLAMPADDPGMNAVVVEVEKEMQEAQIGSADAKGKGKQQDHSDVSENPTGETGSKAPKYVSPSDALMSPCTQQLNALKAKRFSRAGESGVRSLFRDKIEKKEKTGESSENAKNKED